MKGNSLLPTLEGPLHRAGPASSLSIPKNSMAFILALLLYAGLSAPFPANPGVIEALIAVLLILFVTVPVGIIVMSGGFTHYHKYGLVPTWLHLGFFLLLWWQLFNGGVLRGWAVTDIIRDLIPCIYIFLPLMLLPSMKRSLVRWQSILPWTLSAAGVILALRFYSEVQIWPWDLGKRHYFDNFLYLPYDPTVTFASIFLPIMAVQTWKGKSPLRWISSLLMLSGGALTLGSLMAVAQRAPLGLAVLCFLIYFMITSYRSLSRMVLLVVISAAIGLMAQQQIGDSFQLLSAKQEQVGANGKTDELNAVWAEITQSVPALFFGIGWGGLYYSPAVDKNFPVSFTHSAITFFLLKGGLGGLAFFVMYLIWICRKLYKSWSMDKLPVLLASGVPLLIGLIFQVSYKTLSFGVILTLLCLLQATILREERSHEKENRFCR